MSNALSNWHLMCGEPFGQGLTISELADDVGDYLIEKKIVISDYPVADILRESLEGGRKNAN